MKEGDGWDAAHLLEKLSDPLCNVRGARAGIGELVALRGKSVVVEEERWLGVGEHGGRALFPVR